MIDRAELRTLVREVVRDAVAQLKVPPPTITQPPTPSPVSASPSIADQLGLEPSGPRAVDSKNRIETVQLSRDSDLDAFVRKLLRLFESPKTRADLKTGRLSFRLAGRAAPAGGTTHRIDSGAVTERHIAALPAGTLILGRSAVLTPLAKEKARSLGITIQKERT